MGRGLSKLQKKILRLALASSRRDNGVDLYSYEIKGHLLSVDVSKATPGSQNFDVSKIGQKRYNSVKASVSRCISRLEQRGLITVYVGTISHWTGITLTEAGETLAKQLTVNSKQKIA